MECGYAQQTSGPPLHAGIGILHGLDGTARQSQPSQVAFLPLAHAVPEVVEHALNESGNGSRGNTGAQLLNAPMCASAHAAPLSGTSETVCCFIPRHR